MNASKAAVSLGEALDVGVGHGPRERDPVALSGQHVARGVEAGEVARPRDLEPGLPAVRAPEPELDQPRPPATSTHRAARAAISDWKWTMLTSAVSTSCASSSGAGHLEHRLVREEHRPLAHRAHLAVEAEPREPVEEGRAEESGLLEVGRGRRRVNRSSSRNASASSIPAATR